MAEPKNVEKKPEKPVLGKKLELRKKMGTITMVTPPSFFQNQNRSFVLINLSKRDKDNFADAINKHMPKEDITLYLWDDNNFSNLDPFGAEEDAEYEKYLEENKKYLERQFSPLCWMKTTTGELKKFFLIWWGA